MKKILFTISLLFSLLVTSCSNEEMDVPLTDNEMVELTFSVNIPEMQVASRTFSGNNKVSNVTSLQLLVFDATSGMMFACPMAFLDENDNDTETLKYYTVKLPKTVEPCIIHFVANAEEITAQRGTEEKILSQINVSNETGAYWNRITVDGINEDLTLPKVSLIRNFACIEVIDNTDAKNFLDGYILGNKALHGTVAPYFGGSQLGFANFSDYLATEGNETSYQKVTENYIGIEPAGNAGKYITDFDEVFSDSPKYAYERRYDLNNVVDETYVIVKGAFDKNKNGKIGDDEHYYYRIDIAENLQNLRLIRNFKYKIYINAITEEGYTSASAAATGSSFNNLVNVDIRVEEVSDGVNTLKVSPTDITVVCGTQSPIEFGYEFSGVEGSNVWATSWTPGDVFTNITKDNDSFNVTLKTYTNNNVTAQGGNASQTFEVRGGTEKNYVSRTININLINRKTFTTTASKNNGNHSLNIKIPSGLFKSMFPLEIMITEVNSNVVSTAQPQICTFTPVVGQDYPMTIEYISKPITNNSSTRIWGYKLTIPALTEQIQKNGLTINALFKANNSFTGNKYLKVENMYAETSIVTITNN